MKKTLITLIIGIIIGFILAQVISPPYQVVSSSSQTGYGAIKMNRWTGKTWFLNFQGYQVIPYWQEINIQEKQTLEEIFSNVQQPTATPKH